MNPESDKHHEYLWTLATLGVVAVSLLAFSRPVRRQIQERDKADVWDGSTENLEAAHIDHDRSNPRYNDASNGRLLKRRNHYLDHYNRSGTNGLTIEANNWALRTIWERLTDEEREGLPPPP